MRKLLTGALLLCAACTSGVPSPPTPTEPPPTATSHLSTHAGPVIQSTLPPSWTPTFTPSPSLTWTPTPTATLTPVPRPAQLCDSFRVEYGFDNGHTFFWDDTISMILGTSLSVVRDADTDTDVPLVVRFLATHTETGVNLGAELNGGQITMMELSARRLVNPGDYTWKAYLFAEGAGERCVHRGSFSVYPSADALTTTAEVTAES